MADPCTKFHQNLFRTFSVILQTKANQTSLKVIQIFLFKIVHTQTHTRYKITPQTQTSYKAPSSLYIQSDLATILICVIIDQLRKATKKALHIVYSLLTADLNQQAHPLC